MTLVQLAMVYAAIANGGTLYVPQLVRAVEAPDGSVMEDFPPRVRRRVDVDPQHLTYVIDGMFGVVNDPKGTAYEARIEGGVPVAGKTGTAQVGARAAAGHVDGSDALVLPAQPRVVRGLCAGRQPRAGDRGAGRARWPGR